MKTDHIKTIAIVRFIKRYHLLPSRLSHSNHLFTTFVFFIVIGLLPVSGAIADSDSDSDSKFKISSAKWDNEKSTLKVKGKGKKKLSVTLSNADTQAVLATQTSNKKKWKFKIANPTSVPCRVRVEQSDGAFAEKKVKKAPADCDDGNNTPPPPPPSSNAQVRVLAANDLGMHCADKDYQILSILPPFNVVHAQAILKGTDASLPRVLSNLDVGMEYSATSSATDPAGANSINTTSQNTASVFKTNFWQQTPPGSNNTLAGLAYALFYPSSVLSIFEPIPVGLGLPVPDVAALPALIAKQQAMPGTSNTPQDFLRFDKDVHFFGNVITDVNWFAADGIPLLPVDDQGRSNPYPLMKVAATDKTTGTELDSVPLVLPVASEADCQNCHADPDDAGDGAATTFASVPFDIVKAANAPGPERLQNAAKMNILRVHDAKHGLKYTSSVDASAAICNPSVDPASPNCLANQTPIQCAQCHYTPALDLAQVGPINETTQGIKGRQQLRHISMSRAMHFNHASYKNALGDPAFQTMPSPNDPRRTSGPAINGFELSVLQNTCYQCHPGNKTQCLRGAMFSGGVVCQDCHGGMKQVGDDFSEGLATGQGTDPNKRVPWASEPKCQSCHTGDALNLGHPAGSIVAKDGIRLIQAYLDTDNSATPIESSNSRFAENQSLYRLSGSNDGSGKGHEGIMCEGCHGSTHAIWPNANPLANDNLTASTVQGHTGSIVECESCHAKGTLGNTLGGPHGMHPVGGSSFADGGHEKLAEKQADSCRSCHGNNGEGTVLSKVATDRSFVIEECEKGTLCPGNEVKNFTVNLKKGEQVSCILCHKNELK